jgi:hypothetical protein
LNITAKTESKTLRNKLIAIYIKSATIGKMSNQLIIHLTDEQLKIIKNHLKEQNEINSKEETFSGFSFTLSCTKMGISWLDLELNSKLEIGDVNWEFK